MQKQVINKTEGYKEVEDLLFPHTFTQSFGPQKIGFTTSSIELNVSFSDEDFQ